MKRKISFGLLIWISLFFITLSCVVAIGMSEEKLTKPDSYPIVRKVIPTEEEKSITEQLEITNPKLPYSLGFVSELFTPTEKIDSKIYSKIEDIPSLKITDTTPQYVKDNYTYGFIMILGKTREEKLDVLKNMGIKLLGYHPYHSYKAKIPLNRINELEQLSFVKWVGYSTSRQKLDSELIGMLNNVSQNKEEIVKIFIALFDNDTNEEFKNILEKNGVKVIKYHPNLNTYLAEAPLKLINDTLINFDFILAIERSSYGLENHDQSIPLIGADYTRSYGYNGSGVRVGMVDSGYTSGHEDLISYSLCGDWSQSPLDCSDSTGHGTHTACSFFGRGEADLKYRGVAPGVEDITIAKVIEDDGSSTEAEIIDGWEWIADVSPTPEVVSSSLSVYSVGCNGTDTASRAIDEAVFNDGVVYVLATGNAGPNSDTLLTPSCAKNAIAVGNIYDHGHGQVDNINASSSRGPADDCFDSDCRQKPDLVAPGTSVTSCDRFDWEGYTTKSGTSMAAPQVAGVIATLIDHYPSWSGHTSLIKARLLSTALNKGGDKSNIGNTYGFGKVDSDLDHWNMNQSDGWVGGFSEGSLTDSDETDYYTIYVPSGSKRLTVVLVWHEPPASADASNAVINDLDLWVDGQWSDSSVDNVEHISIDNPSAGTIDVEIYAYNIAQGPQAWDLAYMITRGDPTPVTNLTNKTSNTSIYINQPFTVTAKVSPSEFVASGVSTNITVPSGVTVLSMNTTREDGVFMNYTGSEQSIEGVDRINLGDIIVGDSREVTWVLKATTSGTKNICVNTNSDNAGINSSCMNIAASNPPPENCTNNIDDDLDSYTDCDDGDCTEGTSCGTNQWCCGSGCSTNGGSCSCAGISGLSCVDGTCNTYNEACCDGELGRNMQCSGISLECIGGVGSCVYATCGAPQWCDGLTPGGSVCEDSPGIYNELACELLGTDCYYQGENDCNTPSGCDEKDENDCSATSGFQCEWQDTYLDNVVEECEYTDCGAISLCDEQQPGYDYASCTTGDQSYFADQCTSSCQGEDRGDNICRSSAFAAGCTADAECDGLEAGVECSADCIHFASETEGRTAIEQGINNSVIGGAIIYTDYYIRYLNESREVIGLFDKITENLNQTWAFNYITAGELFTNMGNLTNKVYVLELTNRTMANVTSEIETFIDATKI
ncbi:hypothetical protein COV19_00150 [Candidatus Woesearchaeota archaeon CG10_big_fil_rev_8_21_14_0_10_44_13]|nr:MAG: hypothetical protein COV19_00150 [Candidatus Woesearchaeota archaeon CG10_big_fil_rev_8_21_14_0_10_44_13]